MINAFTAAACAIVLLIQVDLIRAEDWKFLCTTDNSGRFLALERKGNGTDRTAYLTVFEYLGEGKSLRKLYEAKLLNKKGPLIRELSRDGRFFVTLDEFAASGTSPVTVVIYDLARKEHTAYAGKDFLSDKLIKSLPDHSFIRGFRWFGKDM